MGSAGRLQKHFLSTGALLCGVSLLALADGCSTIQQPDPRNRVNAVVSELVQKKGIAGLTVTILEGDRPAFASAWGFADVEAQIPMEAGTAMQIGSISKIFTAAMVVSLAQAGRIALTDPIGKYLPQAPPQIAGITVRQLLEMTSGVPEYTRHPDYVARDYDFSKPEEFTRQDLRAFVMRLPLDFRPGTRWCYSSSNYALLAGMIEAITGEDYENYLHKTVLSDSAYSALTAFRYVPDRPPKEALGYSHADGGFKRAKRENPEASVGDGGLKSDGLTLARWLHNFATGKLVPETVLAEMRRPAQLEGGRRMTYGAGLELMPIAGLERIGHGGGMAGIVTQASYYYKPKVTVVVMSNDVDVNMCLIEAAVLRAWLNLPKPEYQEHSLAPEEIDKFLGTYDLVERWVKIEGTGGEDLRMVITNPGPTGALRRTMPLMYLGDGVLAARQNPEFYRLRFPQSSHSSVPVDFEMNGLEWLAIKVRN